MKKVFSFILIALTLLSCVVFSACGNKYKNLKMRVMSLDDEVVEQIDFSIENGFVENQTIKVVFSGIDKGDVGQIKVSSYPTKLVEDSNYRYDGKSCLIDILPIRSTKNQNAKLIIKHLSSGKKISVDLNIDEKANSIQTFDKTYIVSIPDLEKDENQKFITNQHRLDLLQVSSLSPETSTDKVYFKFETSAPSIKGVTYTKLAEKESNKIDWGENTPFDLFTGFEVNGETENDKEIEVYPVTIYRNKVNIVGEKPIKIKFKKILTQDNVKLTVNKSDCEDLDLNKLQLIANDNQLQSLILQVNYVEKGENGEEVLTKLIDKDFFEMYDIVPNIHEDCPINIIEDANKDIVVQLAIKTDDYEYAEIKLVPKNYVGDLQTVTKSIKVKGELKANGIAITKNGKDVENQKFDIFNYYEEGNSLGTEFIFTPYANSYEPINNNLRQMQLSIDPVLLYWDVKTGFKFYTDKEFLDESVNEKVFDDNGNAHTVCSEKYALVIHKYSTPMKFYYDSKQNKMISEPFDESDKIYIKHTQGNGKTESTKLQVVVETINNATKTTEIPSPDGIEPPQIIREYPHWKDLKPTDIKLDFSSQEGVVSMELAVGTATVDPYNPADNGTSFDSSDKNIPQVYLERTLIEEHAYYYVQPRVDRVNGLIGVLTSAKFTVEVKPQFEDCYRPLKIQPNNDESIDGPVNEFQFQFNNKINEVIKFVYDADTTVGNYEVIFKQEENIKAKLIVSVYESLKQDDFTLNNIELDGYVIKNYLEPDKFKDDDDVESPYHDVDFIVAVGEKLKLSVVNLPQSVVNSGVIASYNFEIRSDPTNPNIFFGPDYDCPYLETDQELGSNFVMLSFKKGTLDNKQVKTVKMTVTLQQQLISFEGIAQGNYNKTVSLDLDFFIYEKITTDTLSFSETNALRYYKDTLGVMYENLASINIKINIDSNVKDYVTKIEWIESGKIFEVKDENNPYETGNMEYSAKSEGTSEQKIYIARVKQFNETFELRCVVDVKPATLTEKILIKSPVQVDANQEYYINLKKGGEYQVVAENFSSLGMVTFPEILIQVYDKTGDALPAQEFFEINQDESKIKVLNLPETKEDFKLVVFAKDVLRLLPSGDLSGYDNPEIFIMDNNIGVDTERYKKAYFVMDIKLSDGTAEHPYLISSSEEFWELDDSDVFKKSYWELQRNITLASDPQGFNQIVDFSGNLSTIKDRNGSPIQLTIDYVKITNKSLFKNFKTPTDDPESSKISNITFNVSFDVKFPFEGNKIGLFDTNDATLENISVISSGIVNLPKTIQGELYFGSLVGQNNGIIRYTSTEGVTGSIKFTSEKQATETKIHIGGLVGQNLGKIQGNEDESNNMEQPEDVPDAGAGNWVLLESEKGRKNALSQIQISIIRDEQKFNAESSIGGLVGSNNNKGTISNAYINAKIDAKSVSNVGGVIGINNQQLDSGFTPYPNPKNGSVDHITGLNEEILTNENKEKAIYNVKSVAIINAQDNVGGITGSDMYGLYIDCDFQIQQNEGVKVPALIGNNNVGGIAGKSTAGKFFYCSTMSYYWTYSNLQDNPSNVIADNLCEDIQGVDYVAGIAGRAFSASKDLEYQGVIVAYSSTNAYLCATKVDQDQVEIGNIGGIVNNDESVTNKYKATIVINAYFIGRLVGDVQLDPRRDIPSDDEIGICISNDTTQNILFNYVYSINLRKTMSGITVLQAGSYENGGPLKYIADDYDDDNDKDYWGWLDEVNGNYAFVSIDQQGDIPIFDRAPEKLEVEVAYAYQEKDIDGDSITNILFLDYYDFSQDANLTETQLLEIDNHFNRNKVDEKNLLKLFNYQVYPHNLGGVTIKVESDKDSVVRVTQNGFLEVMGVGECLLTFSSVLNPTKANATIKVVVDYPIGDSFAITTDRLDDDKIVGIGDKKSSIAVGFSQQYYVVTEGSKTYNFAEDLTGDYYYKTQDNPNLELLIDRNSSDVVISDYISIGGGISLDETNDLAKAFIKNDTPFVISVNKKLDEGKTFTFTVKAYKEIDGKKVYYKKESNKQNSEKENNGVTSYFDLATAVGPTNVAFSFDDAIIYPNDLVQIFAHISTDKTLSKEDVFIMMNGGDVFEMNTNGYELIKQSTCPDGPLVFDILRGTDFYGTLTIKIENLGATQVVGSSDASEDNIQTVEFNIWYERGEKELTTELSFTAIIQTVYGQQEGYDNQAEVNFTLIPQRINKFDVKNYYYKNVDNEKQLVKENILKSNEAGVVQIDLVPDNGYFSYLEISDVTGDQEVLFTQIVGFDENGEINNEMVDDIDEISSDKKGIKLNKVNGATSVFVRTRIDKSYNNKVHTFEIRAYSAEDKLLYSQPHYVDVKMLPNITMEFLKPDGSVDTTAIADPVNSDQASTRDAWLANRVDAEFRVKVTNSNTSLEHAKTSVKLNSGVKESDGNALADKYEFIHDVNDYYVLKRKSIDDDNFDGDIGKELTLTLSTSYLHDNGDVDHAECSITFTIAKFVIHDVTVTNSLVNNKGQNEIYGFVEKDVNLELYFGKNDISYYDETAEGNPYWDTEYRAKNMETDGEQDLIEIRNILVELNKPHTCTNNPHTCKVVDNNSYSDYLKLDVDNDEPNHISFKEESNTLFASAEVDKSTLNISFEVDYTASAGILTWNIHATDGNSTNQKYTINKDYVLNFYKATAWYDPVIIFDEEDFLAMESGTSYILANDLTFNKYMPVNLDLLEFDGNGRTITINSFDNFKDQEIKAGLFAEVYENMIVKNVVVKYGSSFNTDYYYDLCNGDANYTKADFGGIAAINNGIITNCHVEGSVRLRASVIEQKKIEGSGSYQTNVFIGGVVSYNTKTGYITNSTTKLNIDSQSNIGGFVYANEGKIASSGIIDAKIYTYNNQVENTIVIKVAGFVVDNMGEISMSYVKLRTVINPSNSKTISKTISAKDISAGFVYTNNGKVYDSYVSIDEMGFNNNVFAGFVYTNAGTVERSFTYINKGQLKNSSDSLFAPRETEGLKDCIEFVVNKYNNNIESGLVQELTTRRIDKNVYIENNFAFGDNISAVWTIQSSLMPTLVAESEISRYEGDKKVDGLLTFFEPEIILDNITGVEEKVYTLNTANYGTKANPYIIHSAVDIKDENGNIIVQNTWKIFTGSVKDILNGTEHETKNYYFRIVRDIDFSTVGNNPETYKHTFSGNIQGNNMLLKNIMIYSVQEQESIGLFKDMVGVNSSEVDNAVRNLKLSTTSVWASRTQAVGLLAGVIENFNLYNITIDSEDIIMVGGNTVGGVAGLIRGKFDIDSLSSNIGANSNRATGLGYHSIYMSKNNRLDVSENLEDVYYAGSIAGILDGYDRSLYLINSESGREISSNYFNVKNVSVNGNIVILGDTVGSAFGFIGERTYVSRISVNISGELSGYQYSGAVVGENRGVINNKINPNGNAQIIFADNIFTNSSNMSAGVAGLNIGGLVINVDVVGNIKLSGSKTVGGIVGKNVHGVIANTYFDGELLGYIVGGAVAEDYTSRMYTEKTSGSGAISLNNRGNKYLITTSRVEYKENKQNIENYQNISFARKTMKYLTDNINRFYRYSYNSKEEKFVLQASRLLGMIVGLTGYSEDVEMCGELKVNKQDFNITSESSEGFITFNAINGVKIEPDTSFEADLLGLNSQTANTKDEEPDEPAPDDPTPDDPEQPDAPDPVHKKTYINAYKLNWSVGDFELYLVGSLSYVADMWDRNYNSKNFIVLIK